MFIKFLFAFINVFSMKDNVDGIINNELKSLECIIETNESSNELYDKFVSNVIYGKKEVVELFLTKGFDPHKKLSCAFGFNAFMYALALCYEDIIQLILPYCSVEDVNRQDDNDDTPLMIIGKFKQREQQISESEIIRILNLLLYKGANPNIQNKHKNNILFKYHQSEAILKTCIQNSRWSIDFELTDKTGRTVLMLVVEKNDAVVLRLLLASGAKWNAKKYFGERVDENAGPSCKQLLIKIRSFFNEKKDCKKLVNENKNNLWFLVPVIKTAARVKRNKGCIYYKKMLYIHSVMNSEKIDELVQKRRFNHVEYKNMELLGLFYNKAEIDMKNRLYKANDMNFSYIPIDININYLKY